jgi:hypothetical protein
MSDDRGKRDAPDNKRIDVQDPYEVRHWTKPLGVTEQQLKHPVA